MSVYDALRADRELTRRVGRFRERQYQLAAQKHNETSLKYNYYQQTARYFERECGIAKHYDSWNFKDLNPKRHTEKAKKAERLLVRRNRLRTLLQEEERIYRKELEERKAKRNNVEEPSLEVLKEKLKEKRAEQSLYLPKTCRRYQSYFVCPKEPDKTYSNKNTDFQRSRICRDSTNFFHQDKRNLTPRNPAMSTVESKTLKMQEDMPKSSSSQDLDESYRPDSKYLTRHARKSLEDTNIRRGDSSSYDEENEEVGEKSSSVEELPSKSTKTKEERDETDKCHLRYEQDEGRLIVSDAQHFESEKSLPWMRMVPHEKNLSKLMFLYLSHQELKHDIDDLTKRELHACTKQYWDEALRLRDMRNRLELIREKRLFHMDDLELNDDIKQKGLVCIGKREEELARRENACTDSTMYSDDAKDLWSKWVREDEESMIKDARSEREILMQSLEKEWQKLAVQDKEKISHSYENVIKDSWLQDEYKLTTSLRGVRPKSHARDTE